MQLSMAPGAKPYEEWMAQLNAQYGLDKGIVPGLSLPGWATPCSGNFGDSWKYTVPVLQKFNDVIWVSFIMGAISLMLELIIAIPLGVVAATKQYSQRRLRHHRRRAGGYLAAYLFLRHPAEAAVLREAGLVRPLRPGRPQLCAAGSAAGQFLDKAHHLVLPIVTLVIVSVGSLMRYTRTNMLEVLNSDYIRTARAKGLS